MTTAQPSVKTYTVIFIVLMLLLAATVAVAFLPLGRLNDLIALVIAFVKASLVVLFFMHVRYSSPLTWLALAAALLCLGILLVLSMADYDTRAWIPQRFGSDPESTNAISEVKGDLEPASFRTKSKIAAAE